MTMECTGCDLLYINGHKCHEHGCPEAWKDDKRECKWCGQQFVPEDRDQQFCNNDCAEAYFG